MGKYRKYLTKYHEFKKEKNKNKLFFLNNK